MYLAKVEAASLATAEARDVESCGHAWGDWPHSTISHHGRACCDIAREWMINIDAAQLSGASIVSGPRWLRQRYKWGPSPWPLFWCEAADRKRLDCGAHAAIAHELFTARGVKSRPAQFVQQYTKDATLHWHDNWRDEDINAAWVSDDLIYHEGCAVDVIGRDIRLWDASAGWWINPRQSGGYGSLLSVRVFGARDEVFVWGDWPIRANAWIELGQGAKQVGSAKTLF